MTVLTEGKRTSEFLVSEANGWRSRESATVVSGQNLVAGAVVAKITASGKYTEFAPGGTDGSETAAGVLYAGVDATGADAPAVIVARDAEVNAAELAWPDGATQTQINTATGQLAGLGIVTR